jgi:putative SOS response-associated peptidase YedK
MCGRFTLFSDGAELARLFGCGYDVPLQPRHKIAPGQPVPVVRLAAGDGPLAYSRPAGAPVALLQSPGLPTATRTIVRRGPTVQPQTTHGGGHF